MKSQSKLLKPFNVISHDRFVYISILLFVGVLSFLTFNRSTLNYGVETDFLGAFVPEAIRFLNGSPLIVDYHPPFYSITLATIYLITKDWIAAGLILSLLSSFIVIISSYNFFKLKFTRLEAVGAILALGFSWTFISYSMQASSDMFFLALFYGALTTIALAETRDKSHLWFIAGLLAGMAFITRANGVTLILFLLFPLAAVNRKLSKTKIVTFLVIGLSLPILVWFTIARIYESPIYPQSNYKNLAMTYYSNGASRTSGDSLKTASEGFTSAWQVLTKNPKLVFFTYSKDLFANLREIFSRGRLVPFPLISFAIPGLIILFFNKLDKFRFIIMINLVFMILLLNFHGYSDRFYLFMIPFMGAGIASLFNYIFLILKRRVFFFIFSILVTFTFAYFIYLVAVNYNAQLGPNASADSLAASKILTTRQAAGNNIIISRKPHLRFYARSKGQFFPNVQTILDLRSSIKKTVAFRPNSATYYLFYGCVERKLRPRLKALGTMQVDVHWLKRIDHGTENGGWVLYEILPDRL